MKVPYCPKCDTTLKVVPFGDGTCAGRCPDCGAYWPLVIGMEGYQIQRRYWEEDESTC